MMLVHAADQMDFASDVREALVGRIRDCF